MQKQLSKKSHKITQSSVDDFMKHIKKYNLQSERYISPKPLLYMYTNPSRHFTLQTLQKSRSKSKTLSNRQLNKQKSQSKRNNSKNILIKVEKMLSLSKNHKKSISLLSYNDRSHKKSNKSIIQLCESTKKVKDKSKIHENKELNSSKKQEKSKENKQLKQTFLKNQKKHTKSKTKIEPKYTENFSIQNQQSIIDLSQQNPADLIQIYSRKLNKVEKYLQSRNQLGSILCKKFQQILNQIIECLVNSLKKSLNQLQYDIHKRLERQYKLKIEKYQKYCDQRVSYVQKICQKLAQKVSELLKKQNYTNTLIYNLRKQGIDIDKQFGKAVWDNQQFGGRGYLHENSCSSHSEQDSFEGKNEQIQKTMKIHQKKKESQKQYQDKFEFVQHPKTKIKKQINEQKQFFCNLRYIQQQQEIKESNQNSFISYPKRKKSV